MAKMTASFSGPLTIAAVPFAVPVGGAPVIGIVACPGRDRVDAGGRRWRRDLEADLTALETWRARALVSLVEAHEFSRLGVPEFEAAVRRRTFRWYRLPIANMAIPGAAFQKAWNARGDDILRHLERGERIVVHCSGGLGRSGTIAAKLLTAFGTPPAQAIAAVRAARPGAIETRAQETYVLSGPALAVIRPRRYRR